jgi:hypothetical protein
METLRRTIIIKRPKILDIENRSFKDWGNYRKEYVEVLDKQLCELFSNAHEYFCNKENKLVGRDSWLGHENTIKPTKNLYIYEFWNMENIEEFSFGFHSTKGEVIGKLVVDIKWA